MRKCRTLSCLAGSVTLQRALRGRQDDLDDRARHARSTELDAPQLAVAAPQLLNAFAQLEVAGARQIRSVS
jgi:hypothetical protein